MKHILSETQPFLSKNWKVILTLLILFGFDSVFDFLFLILLEENLIDFLVVGASVDVILLIEGRGTKPSKLYIAGLKLFKFT